MEDHFAENLQRLRTERGYTQQQLAKLVCVDRSSIARWESGTRVPDLILLARIADCLEVEPSALLLDEDLDSRIPTIIMVDDERAILAGNMGIVCETIPAAEVTGFLKPSEALRFVRFNHVDIAFLDIAMGKTSGIDLCEQMIEINPRLNVFFLTAYPEYSLRSWETHACGFLVKPLVPEDLRKQLRRLRHPVSGLSLTEQEENE
ncbi:MAG: response regulator [Clostridia bacterium]|jgi:transcriptional regulator with XRE-family HTH domain|nr:response regulator [Clostridia bacterium]